MPKKRDTNPTLPVADPAPATRVIDTSESQVPINLDSALAIRDEPGQLAVQPSVAVMLDNALQRGASPESLDKLMQLYERMEAIRRESLFNAAFTAFKSECPPIVRRTRDEYITVTRNGVKRARMYASLDDISATCDPYLHKHGLTYDWLDAELTAGGSIIRRFVLRHVAGHSRPPVASPPIPIEGGADYKALDAGRKGTSASPQQRIGVADTYAKRYSMTSGLGVPTCDQDDDGNDTASGEKITESQAANVQTLLDELVPGKESQAKFRRWMGVETLAEIPANRLQEAISAIESKRKQT